MVEFSQRHEESSNISFAEIREQTPHFISGLLEFGESIGLTGLDQLEIDHVGVRVAGIATVDRLRREIEQAGAERLSTALVGFPIKRRIVNYKLKEALSGNIPCIELPYPAQKHDFDQDGLEHAEFVLRLENGEDIELAFKRKFPDFTGKYKISSPSVKGEQLDNTTIVIENPNDKMQCIKIHAHTIEEVIKSNK